MLHLRMIMINISTCRDMLYVIGSSNVDDLSVLREYHMHVRMSLRVYSVYVSTVLV